MTQSQPIDGTIGIRSGLYLPIVLICIATLIFLVGLLFFIPFMRGYNPPIGLPICGGAAALGVVGFLLIKYRRPQVYLTPDKLQLPGFGIERILWGDIVRVEVVEVQARGVVDYLCIDVTDAARGRIKQPRLLKLIGSIAGAMGGKSYDLMLNCDTLEWSATRLAKAISSRVSETALPAAR